MANERETRTERDFWGTEREYIYEGGKRVGEYKFEDRGGILGFGDERQKVEYDLDGREIGYSRQERSGGILGFGEEDIEAAYDRDGNRTGYSRVEERGGFLGFGTHHERIGYDENDDEVSSTRWERRGGFLGIGEHRARVTRFSDRDRGEADYESSSSENSDMGDWLGKLIVVVLAVCFLIWFTFNVVLPLAIINVAALALVGSRISTEHRQFLLIVSAVGAVYVLLDYNVGWLTRGLAQTLPFMADWMSAFVYINVSAGLISAYPLLEHAVSQTMPAEEGNLRTRRLILVGCLLAAGGGIFAAQGLVDPRWNRDHATTSNATEPSFPRNMPDGSAGRHDASSGQVLPTASVSPQGDGHKAIPSASSVDSPPPQAAQGTSRATATTSANYRRNELSTATPVAVRAIACVLPDGREERVTAERCESAGGMEYK